MYMHSLEEISLPDDDDDEDEEVHRARNGYCENECSCRQARRTKASVPSLLSFYSDLFEGVANACCYTGCWWNESTD